MSDLAWGVVGLTFWALVAWASFFILRAIWRAISAPSVARAVGSTVTKLEDAYKEGRGR
jgi:hypothetical protein